MADLTHNNNVGRIPIHALSAVAIKGTGGDVDQTTDTCSIIGLRYLKDDELGTGSTTTTLQDIDSLTLKNWFAQYVSTLGNFVPDGDKTKNIKWSDYKGATILGFKIEVVNETYEYYKKNNNAGIKISPLNGTYGGTYTVTVGDQGTTSANYGSTVSLGRFGYGGNGRFDGGGGTQNVRIKDNTTGIELSLTWKPGYINANSYITTVSNVSTIGKRFNFTWGGETNPPNPSRSGNYSDDLYLFLGEESTRPYGESYQT